jgi:hypothetical protein
VDSHGQPSFNHAWFFMALDARPANTGVWPLNAKIVLTRQCITAAIRHYHVGLPHCGTYLGGQAVIEYVMTYFAVFTVLAFTLLR